MVTGPIVDIDLLDQDGACQFKAQIKVTTSGGVP